MSRKEIQLEILDEYTGCLMISKHYLQESQGRCQVFLKRLTSHRKTNQKSRNQTCRLLAFGMCRNICNPLLSSIWFYFIHAAKCSPFALDLNLLMGKEAFEQISSSIKQFLQNRPHGHCCKVSPGKLLDSGTLEKARIQKRAVPLLISVKALKMGLMASDSLQRN